MTTHTDTEAERIARFPGIEFRDNAAHRRAGLIGGLDVWEVVRDWKALDRDWHALREHLHWLTEDHLRTALAYYAGYPNEIDERLAREHFWTPERVYEAYPFMKPAPR